MSAHTNAAAKTAPSTLILLREDIAGVAVLTLNDPETRNSLSEAMLEALGDALTAIAHDKSVRAVVLAANGPAFSAGHNLKEWVSRRRSDEDGGRAYFKHMMTTCSIMMQQIVTLPQPVIAAVQATATAAGCQLVAKLRPRRRLADRQVRHAWRQYRPVLGHLNGRALAQRFAQARDGDAPDRRTDRGRACRAHRPDQLCDRAWPRTRRSLEACQDDRSEIRI